MSSAPNVVVIGARSARQGIGEFVAGWFAKHGVRVSAVVGTTADTVAAAQQSLRQHFAIECRGYTEIATALASEPAEIIAICSPYRLHAEHLAAVGRAGRHCLCEKPLIWPAPPTDDPVAAFVASGKCLRVLTQWPSTLPTYFALHPEQSGKAVERFEMRLSPITSGLDMVPDAVPHFLSLVRALVGTAQPGAIKAEFADGDPRGLRIDCAFTHARGATKTTLHLTTCLLRPRPAWYAINGAQVEREVELTGYQQFFRAGSRRVALPDPLGLLVAEFLADVAEKRPFDRAALDHDQKLLTVFHDAVRAAGAGGTI